MTNKRSNEALDAPALKRRKTDEKRHKRAPQKPPTMENDIWISRKTPFPAICKRSWKLWTASHIKTFYIHALGAAIPLAVNVALELQKKTLGQATWTITTNTVELVDDLTIGDDESVEKRNNSAIHIKIHKPTKR
jgi:hypothetical protein